MKCSFDKSSEKIEDKDGYVKMSYQATRYYADGDTMYTNLMVIEYNKAEGALEFRNDDEYYGQGQLISFGAIKRFKKYLKANGYEVR